MKLVRNTVSGSSSVFRQAVATTVLGLAAVLVAGCSSAGGVADGRDAPPSTQRPEAAVRITPADGAGGVSPIAPVTAKADHAKITEVVLTNSAGERVDGTIGSRGHSWSADKPLGYGKTYTVSVTAKASGGRTITKRSEFTTVTPEHTTYVSMNPIDGQTVGVGQPLAFYFSDDAPPPNRKKAERAINISTDPAVEGEFYWIDDREVHWRPEDYWEPGTKITVDVEVYGKDLGNGVYGETDRTATIEIGDSVILRADGASHRMSVQVNGEVVRTIPVSLGSPKNPSHNGTHVVMRKHPSYVMDSRTFGLPLDEGGYKIETKWAVRISNSGEFLHSAPWSVGAQGNRNVSHGCINMSPADAKWVYDLVQKGDVVEITNSGGPPLPVWDGFGDWQLSWSEWKQGSR